MSLDVYLEVDKPVKRKLNSGIFIRENGRIKEISREEWDRRHPGLEPVAYRRQNNETTFAYSGNITNNLTVMAEAAGIYKHLWRPEEIGVTKAGQLIKPLDAALIELSINPAHYKQFNPPNGYGDYNAFVEFVVEYLEACKEHPEASIIVDR